MPTENFEVLSGARWSEGIVNFELTYLPSELFRERTLAWYKKYEKDFINFSDFPPYHMSVALQQFRKELITETRKTRINSINKIIDYIERSLEIYVE